MLALADLSASRAMAVAHAPDAFANLARGLTSAVHCASTPYHAIAGVHCVRALIANAAGDRQSLAESVDTFIDASPVPADGVNLDLMLGHTGVLIASALLLDAVAPMHEYARRRLAEHGAAAMAAIEEATASLPAMGDAPGFSSMGAAHGWTGLLFATLRWCAVTRRPLSADTIRRLRELGRTDSRGPREYAGPTRSIRGPRSTTPSWLAGATVPRDSCTSGRSRRSSPATRPTMASAGHAAWGTWEHATDSLTNICCGLGGLAYALLARYRATGDASWYRRALRSRRARRESPPPTRPRIRTASITASWASRSSSPISGGLRLRPCRSSAAKVGAGTAPGAVGRTGGRIGPMGAHEPVKARVAME